MFGNNGPYYNLHGWQSPRIAWDYLNRMGISPGSDPHITRELFEYSCFCYCTVCRVFFARSWMSPPRLAEYRYCMGLFEPYGDYCGPGSDPHITRELFESSCFC